MSHSAERRLTHRTPRNMNTVSDRFIDALRHPEDETRMAQVLRETREAGTEDELREALKNRWENLAEQERGMISSNIARLQDRTEQQSETRKEFLDLVRQIHAPEQAQTIPEPERTEVAAAETEAAPRARTAAPEAVQERTEDTAATESRESFLGSVGTGMEKAAEKLLPRRWTERMSRRQKIAAIAAATAGLAAAGTVLWRGVRRLLGRGKSAHEQASEAAKKSGSWWKKIVVYGAVGTAAFFGIRWLIDYAAKKNWLPQNVQDALDRLNQIPEDAAHIASAASETVGGAAATATEVLTPAGTTLYECLLMLGVPGYELAQNNPMEAMEAFIRHGGAVLYGTAETALIFGNKHIEVGGDLLEHIGAYIHGRDAETQRSFYAVYGAVGTLYAMDSAIIRTILTGKPGLLTHGLKGGAIRLTGRVAAWPAMMVADGYRNLMMVRQEGAGIVIEKLRGWPIAHMPGTRAYEVRQALKLAKATNIDDIVRSMERFGALHNTLDYMRNHPDHLSRMGFSQGEIGKLSKQLEKLAKRLQRSLSNVELPNDAPRHLRELVRRSRGGTWQKFMEKLTEYYPTNTRNIPGGSTASAATNAAPAVRPQSSTSAAARSRPNPSKAPPPPRGAAAAGAGPELAPQTVPRTTAPQPTVPEGWNVVGRDGVRRPANNLASAARETLPTDTKLAKLLQQIDSMKKAGNNRELARLLRDPLLDQAAKQGDEAAQALVTARNAVSRGRWIGRGLIGLGVAIDLAFIGYNEYRIQNALEQGESQLADILQAKRKTLVASGFSSVPLTVATTSFAASSTPLVILGTATAPAWATGIVLAAPVAVGAAYAESIYSNLEEWNTKERDYAGLQGGNILQQIHEWETRRDSAHYAAGHRDSNAMALWRWSTAWTQAAKERRNQHYIKQNEQADVAINLPQRMKLYSAYFLRYSTVSLSATDWESVERRMKTRLNSGHLGDAGPNTPPETQGKEKEQQAAFQEALQHVLSQKQQHMLQAKIAYIQHRSRGNMRLLPPDELERADTYQELLNMKAEMERTGRRPILQYIQEDGSEHTIDLTDVTPGNWQQTDYVISEYMNEYKPRMEFMTAIRDLEIAGSEERSRVKENIRENIIRSAVHYLNRAEQRVAESKLSNMHKMALRQELRLKFEAQVDQVLAVLNDPESTVQQYKKARSTLMHIAEHARDAEKTLQKGNAPLAVLLRKQYRASPGMYHTERTMALRHGDMQKERVRMLQEEGIEAETALTQLAEKANPLVQNMIETAIADLEIHRKPGTNIYKKEGHAGDYIPRPDGSIYYTGGRALNGNKLPPRRYINGRWYWE